MSQFPPPASESDIDSALRFLIQRNIWQSIHSQAIRTAPRTCIMGSDICLVLEVWVEEWVEAILISGLIKTESGKPILHLGIKKSETTWHIIDKRDDGLFEYYQPRPVVKKVYRHALTGRETTVEEGNLKTDTQRIQETIFDTLSEWMQWQLCVFVSHVEEAEVVRVCMQNILSRFVYYTLESGFTEKVALPSFSHNVLTGNALLSKWPLRTAWATLAQRINCTWKEVKDTYNIYAATSGKGLHYNRWLNLRSELEKLCMKSDARYHKLQKLQAQYFQKFDHATLFETAEVFSSSHTQQSLKDEVEALQKILGVSTEKSAEPPIDWGLSLPHFTDEEGVFQGFDYILGIINKEDLTIPNDIEGELQWKTDAGQMYIDRCVHHLLALNGKMGLIWDKNALYSPQAGVIRQFFLTQMQVSALSETVQHTIWELTQAAPEADTFPYWDTPSADVVHTHVLSRNFCLSQPHIRIRTDIDAQRSICLSRMTAGGEKLGTIAEIIKMPRISFASLSAEEGYPLLLPENLHQSHIIQSGYYVPFSHPWVQKYAQIVATNEVIYLHVNADNAWRFCVANTPFMPANGVYAIVLKKPIDKHYVCALLQTPLLPQMMHFSTLSPAHPFSLHIAALQQIFIKKTDSKNQKNISTLSQKIHAMRNATDCIEENVLAEIEKLEKLTFDIWCGDIIF